MAKIYLVRHAQTIWNVEKRMQGQYNSELTKDAKLETEKFAGEISNEEFDILCSSELKRAKETLEIIISKSLVNKDKEKIELSEFNEIAFGKWEGQKIEDIFKKYEELARAFFLRDGIYDPKLIDAEDPEYVVDRFIKGLDFLKEKYGNDIKILIVTHGATISFLLEYFETGSINTLKERKKIKNLECNIINY